MDKRVIHTIELHRADAYFIIDIEDFDNCFIVTLEQYENNERVYVKEEVITPAELKSVRNTLTYMLGDKDE